MPFDSNASFRSLSSVALALALIWGGGWLWASRASSSETCPSVGAVVLVEIKTRTLSLCRAGTTDRVFRVAFGRGGTGKHTEGDERTPVGRYPLSVPRSSDTYHWFIPVEYPTPQQRARGYTGGAIGIHGPHWAFRWLGPATAAYDWTRGCIAVGTRSEVNAIATWVSKTRADEVRIQ